MKKFSYVYIFSMLMIGVVSCSTLRPAPVTPSVRESDPPVKAHKTPPPSPQSDQNDQQIVETSGPSSAGLPPGISLYEVEETDSIFTMAMKFDISAQTIILSNDDLLNDMPHKLKPGMELFIPVVDGVVYRWKAEDHIGKVAARFNVKPELILMWGPNQLDYAAYSRGEQIEIIPQSIIFIPTGKRPMKAFNLPTISP